MWFTCLTMYCTPVDSHADGLQLAYNCIFVDQIDAVFSMYKSFDFRLVRHDFLSRHAMEESHVRQTSFAQLRKQSLSDLTMKVETESLIFQAPAIYRLVAIGIHLCSIHYPPIRVISKGEIDKTTLGITVR